MIRHLEVLIDEFRGCKSQTRCFAHILNLIAKSILQQFDIPRAQVNNDDATVALIELAGNIEFEEEEMDEYGDNDNDDDNSDDQEEVMENTDDWVNEREAMTMEQLAELDKSVQPVRWMLVKVCVNF
jgi:hypothetical protein